MSKTGGRTFSLDAALSNQTYMTALSGSGSGTRMELTKGTVRGLLDPSQQYIDYLSTFRSTESESDSSMVKSADWSLTEASLAWRSTEGGSRKS